MLPLPTKFDECFYKPEWYEQDFFYSPDGIECFPEHHCKLTWEISKPFIKDFRNAIDIGCRDGEYTRYLFNHFKHTYCFDNRLRKYFPYNVDTSKVSHYNVALGDAKENVRLGRIGKDIQADFYRLDDFKFSKIDYIKIDTDGYEMAIIQGGLKTIDKWSPLIVLEVFFERETLEFVKKELGYEHVATCPRGWDHILIRK